jgi:cytochrome c-type biogenesis protein CcmH
MNILLWSLLILMLLIALAVVLIPLGRQRKLLPFIFIIAMPVFAFTLYWHLGASQKLQQYWALKQEEIQVKAQLKKIKDPQIVVDRLKSHLQRHPNSPRGWFLLGKIYFRERRYSEAESALKKAYHQDPVKLQYLVAYAQASFFRQGRRLKPNVLKMLKDTTTIHPNYVPAVNLLAINAYMNKDYLSAVGYWERILPQFQVGTPEQKMILSMIAKAQKKLLTKKRRV